MKIAIFHDYFDEIGGAEITTLILAEELNADIYTTNINNKKIKQLGFQNINIKSIGAIPNLTPLKQYLARYNFQLVKIKNYDFFIFAGPYSLQAAKNHKPNLWYVHSFLKKLYTKQNEVRLLKFLWKYFDQKGVKNIQKIISNSIHSQKEIKKYYNKKSVIIHPPIQAKIYYYKKPKNYWLSVNRLITHKRIDLQLKAFSELPNEKLVIVGSEKDGSQKYFKKLLNKKSKNVSFLGGIYNKKNIIELYANCKGFITTSEDEPFGLTAIEAMASGKPVIAPNEGGYKETITNKTGILINNIDSEKLTKSIRKLSEELKSKKIQLKYKEDCQTQAEKFSTEKFIKKMKKQINLKYF